MYAAFQLELIGCTQQKLDEIFAAEYNTPINQVYSQSIHSNGKVFQQADFFSASAMQGSLILVFKLRADILIFHVESSADLVNLKKTINGYFSQVKRILSKNDVRWKSPEATIFIENNPFFGYVKGFKQQIKGIFKERWEKLLLVPIASLFASFLAVKFHILEVSDYEKDVKKALITTGESYIGLVIVIIITVFLKANKKEFNFAV